MPGSPSNCSSSCSSASSEPGNLREDDGWEDVESDTETLQFVSFFDDQKFDNLVSMLDHCKAKFDFDFVAVRNQLDLDFYDTIKLVNFIRSAAAESQTPPTIVTKDQFQDDKYLIPVIPDDAVLFSVGDLDLTPSFSSQTSPHQQPQTATPESTIAALQQELSRLRFEYDEYRATVAKALDERWTLKDEGEDCKDKPSSEGSKDKAGLRDSTVQGRIDNSYFDSYSYNEIHETMLKDAVRTDAYRDFIYENKHLFAGKNVLDVGCGTGILSMFCAKAGAARVIAVDNSAIINKARENILANGFQNTITCLQGKIEEVVLPVEQVDIIVSEWMGYCLTFEAMLDSVIWARDKYLKPDGLMVPSHCSLVAAPICDSDYVTDSIDFWLDVYGFDMKAMKEKIYDDVQVRQLKPEVVVGSASPFYILPLHTITVEELTFVKPFSATVTKECTQLDGFVVWFDTFFLPSRHLSLPADVSATEFKPPALGSVAFTTGPYSQETHWMSGVLMAEPTMGQGLKVGQKITGTIEYNRAKTNDRGLHITLDWKIEGVDGSRQQGWTLD